MKKHKVALRLVLPSEAAACQACIQRLVAAVSSQDGVLEAHVENGAEARLCLHYDPTVLRLEHVSRLSREAGAKVVEESAHLSLAVKGLRHERHAKLVEGAVADTPGVLHVSAAFGTGQLYIEFDAAKTSPPVLEEALRRAGLESRADARRGQSHGPGDGAEHADAPGHQTVAGGNAEEDHGNEYGRPFGERSELLFSLGCGLAAGIGWGLSRVGVPSSVSLAFFVLGYVLGGWFTLQEVVTALRARRLEIDFLMLLASAGAAGLGEWFEGALLLFLFTLGHALEGFAMGRARKAIEGLRELVPETTLLITSSGEEREVPVATLSRGDKVRVRPNSRVPADGFVAEGRSSVNQAPITGESVPVEKSPVPDGAIALQRPEALAKEHRVFAGTINGGTALTVVVIKASSESTLARVVKMVAEAQTQKSPTQRFTDRFERVFVPTIIVFVILLMFAWLVVDEPFSSSVYRAMAVLVAASPCALAIATPSAVLAGVARAARDGVLIKGGAHLESLAMIKAIAFDKTGTLTEGKPRLTDVAPLAGVSEVELLSIAVAVEKQSDHPLARAIVDGGSQRLGRSSVPTASDVTALTGFGVRGTVGGKEVLIGKPGLFTRTETLPGEVTRAVERLQVQGRTVMVTKASGRFLGVLGLMDSPRASAKAVVAHLHELGVEETMMLTGDNQRVADAVAAEVGIRTALGEMLPEQKVESISKLAAAGRPVAMVGDGVNDAPAMAAATVGIAMGAGGSDVALETADVALMADDLTALPFAVGLSRAARRIIRQNLWASLGMVVFLIPATLSGVAGIGAAVTLHEGSTLLVVINALRLLAHPGRQAAAQ